MSHLIDDNDQDLEATLKMDIVDLFVWNFSLSIEVI